MSDQIPEKTKKTGRKWRVTRRGFLIGLGATGAGLAIGVALGAGPLRRYIAGTIDGATSLGQLEATPDAWFEIMPDNTVNLFVSKVEMGQGIHTAIAQIGAEELGVDWAQVNVVQAGTHTGPEDGMGTGGSASVTAVYEPLRRAAATMREMLLLAAAGQLGADANELTAESAVISAPDGSQMTYADVAAATDSWPEPAEDFEPQLKPISEYKYIGQSMPRVDFEDKIRGRAVYGYDLRVDNMAYGAVARPPSLGAKMVGARAGDAAERDGVIEVVIDVEKGMAGVVADTRARAQSAVRALEVEWEERDPPVTQEMLDEMLVFDGGTTVQHEGNASRTIGDAPTLEAEYYTPFAIHAHLEPQAAMAEMKDGKLRVWGSTQAQNTVWDELADVLEMDAADIEVVPTYLGGGFGRRLNIKAANEAAMLSRAVGRPVHVGWTRPDDMQHGYYRPPTRSRLRANVENGRVTAVNHDQVSGRVAFSFFPRVAEWVLGADFGSWRGAFNFYEGIENRQLTAHLADFPVPTGWWRGLGLLANVFATESFMDEMAHHVGADPVAFRLDHLGDDPFSQRMRGVIEAAAERAGWGEPLPDGRARGIAASQDVDTVVAMVAEVSLNDDNSVRVHKVTTAVDAGLFINPDGAIAQTQGSVVMGLSSTLIEEMTVEDGRVRPLNFDKYPLLTLDLTPQMEVILLESDGQPRGMGEPPIGPVAAAVGNALFALTGRRLRRLPFTPERVTAALQS